MTDKKNEENKPPVAPEVSEIQEEKDADELVHEQAPDSGSLAEHDPDEAVHIEHKSEPVLGNEIDVDDLLHQPDNRNPDI